MDGIQIESFDVLLWRLGRRAGRIILMVEMQEYKGLITESTNHMAFPPI